MHQDESVYLLGIVRPPSVTVGPYCCAGPIMFGVKGHAVGCMNNQSFQKAVKVPHFAKRTGESNVAWASRLANPVGLDGYSDYWPDQVDAYVARDLVGLTEDVEKTLWTFELDYQEVAIFIHPKTADKLLLTASAEDGTPPARWLYGMALELSELVPPQHAWLYDGALYYGEQGQ
jgi:hypothetical protein